MPISDEKLANARAHGFTASNFALVRIEDVNEVAHLTQDLTAFYKPENSQEQFALERKRRFHSSTLALTQQAMMRAFRLEAGLFTACLDQALNDNEVPWAPMCRSLAGDIEITRGQNRTYALGLPPYSDRPNPRAG